MINELKRTKACAQFLMLSLVICSILGEVTDIDCFISKLKTCIELHEEHTNNAATQPFTVFRAVNHKMRIDDLLSLYETLCNKKDMEDHLTVMTIAYDMSDEPYNKKTFSKEFISAIQQIVDLKTSYVTQGNLSMKVKYIEREHMSEMLLSDMIIDNLRKLDKIMNEWIIANYVTICQSLFKVFITHELEIRIRVLIGWCKNSISADNMVELWIEQMSYAVIASLRRISNEGILDSFLHQLLLDNQIIFDAIHDMIVQYEKSIDCSYFTDDIYAFKKTYVSLFTDKYLNVIKKSFLFMIESSLFSFGSIESINFVKDIYRTTLIKITQDIDAEVVKKEFDHAEMNIYFEGICQSVCFQNKVESLLQFLYSEISQPKLAETLQKNVNEVYQAPHDTINITIAFEFQLDEYNMYRIFRILNDIEAFENHHQNQFMYIEDASNCAETTLQLSIDNLNKLGLQSYSSTEPINISYITFAPSINPLTYKVYSWTYNPKTKLVLNNDISSVCNIASKQNTTIALDLCYMIKNDEVMKGIITNRLKRSNSKINVLLKINIHNEKESLHVYVLNHVSEDGLSLEHNTLVYVLHSNNIDDENLCGEKQTKQTKCVDAFTGIYDNLLSYIQYLQLGKGTDIEIPNIRLFGSKDFAYSEETLLVRLHNDPFAIHTPHSWYHFVQASISYVNTAISLKEIIEFGTRMNYENYDSYTLKVLRRKGINSHTLNQILYKFVLNKDVAYRPEEYPLATDKHKTDCSAILYLDFNSDDSVILNICTLKAYNHFHHVLASVDKIIAEISENENDLAVYNAIVEGLKSVSPKLSLRQLIIDDFCKRSIPVKDSKKCVPIGSGTKGTMATILNSLHTLFLYKKAKTCQAITKTSLSSQYRGLQNVQQIIKPEEIVRLEKIISEKFKDLVWTKHYTFTRIKLSIPDPNVSA